ncbi:hypothetical protein [Thiomonas sp.]
MSSSPVADNCTDDRPAAGGVIAQSGREALDGVAPGGDCCHNEDGEQRPYWIRATNDPRQARNGAKGGEQ